MPKQNEKHENADVPISQKAYERYFREHRRMRTKDLEFDSFFWGEW